MRVMVCEVCGGKNFIKSEGSFVCQDCGMKYSPEDAKALLKEVEDAPGAGAAPVNTVRVDVSDELKNLYQVARRARADNNSENAARYYDMILVKDPNSWEASFYNVYYRSMGCKIAQIQSAAIDVDNNLRTTLGLIRDYVGTPEEQLNALREVSRDSSAISSMLYNAAMNHYNGIGLNIRNNYTQEMLNNCCAARDIVYHLGDLIESSFPGRADSQPLSVTLWKQGIEQHKNLMMYFAQKDVNKNIIMDYAAKIQKYDSTYQAPTIDTTPKKGCYVATAVYGSYDCPEVWTLRRYRDNVLAETWYGRLFIRTYYAISPTLVRWFGETEWFRNMWKPSLDRMVGRLRSEGMEDTPYEDRNW